MRLRIPLIGFLTSLLLLSGTAAQAKAESQCDPCVEARRAAAKLKACGLAIKKAMAAKKPGAKKPNFTRTKVASKKVQTAKAKVKSALSKAKEVAAKKVAAKTRAKKGEKISPKMLSQLDVEEKQAAKGVATAQSGVAQAIKELTDVTMKTFKEAGMPLVVPEPAASEYRKAPKRGSMSERQEEEYIDTSLAKMTGHDNEFEQFAALGDEASEDRVGDIIADLGDDLGDEANLVEVVYEECEETDAEEAVTGDDWSDDPVYEDASHEVPDDEPAVGISPDEASEDEASSDAPEDDAPEDDPAEEASDPDDEEPDEE